MCGIAGVYFHDANNPVLSAFQLETLVDELLLGIEHRGYDATGVAAVTASNELHIEKADLPASMFNGWRKSLPEKTQTVLLHTRFATQGTPMNLENNHPIHYDSVLVTHNGHIHNDAEIFEDEKLKRNAEVDSECIAALVEKYGIEKVNVALGKLGGNYAVAVADLRSPGTLVLAKGWSSPLYYYEAPEGICWASTEDTITKACKVALGINIQRKDIESLTFGRLLLIENGEIEKLSFPTYKKPVENKRSYASMYDLAWGGEYYDHDEAENKREKEWQERLAKWNKEREEKKALEDDPDHIEFWENESHEMAYTVRAGGHKMLFKTCDGCEHNIQTTLLTISSEGYIFCPDCVEFLDAETKQLEDDSSVVHEVIIDLISEEFKTNADFVDWLLFQSDDAELDNEDTNLVSLYIQFQESYDEKYKELTGKTCGTAQRWADIAEEWEEDGFEYVEEDEEIVEECGVQVFQDNSHGGILGLIRNGWSKVV